MAGQVLEALQHRRMTLGPAGREQGDGKAQGFRHWQLAWDDSGTAWLLLNRQGSSVNTLNAEAFDELSDILNNLTEEPPAALVIRSAKPTGFCAGADVGEFANLDRKEPVQEALDRAHAVLDRLEVLAFPTIAVIHGDCLGAGLELALACDFRIAIDGAKLGFPEVRLGLHPGLGGTVRLTGLIDPTEAMTLMLTGKSAHTAKAADLGLVDAVTQERHVRNAVRAAAAGELKGAKPGLKATALNSLAAREIASRQMRSKAEEKARAEHYPAPFKLIDLWREHGGDSAAMRKAETESFAELVLSETAQNLIRVFFLREGLKREGSAAAEVRHVHVIGAGAMGGDIAGLCAINGLRVSLSDIDRQMIGDAIKRTKTMAEQKHLGPRGLREALDRLVPDRENQGVRYAD